MTFDVINQAEIAFGRLVVSVLMPIRMPIHLIFFFVQSVDIVFANTYFKMLNLLYFKMIVVNCVCHRKLFAFDQQYQVTLNYVKPINNNPSNVMNVLDPQYHIAPNYVKLNFRVIH